MRLTIAIPTYNRNSTLLKNLQPLMPQLTPACRLLIIDNCSDVPVAETLGPLLARFSDADVEIVRNRVNIGGNANIMRCFELAETELVWVLADDDTPRPGAIETIFEQAVIHPECAYFNYSSGYFCRDRQIETRGVKGLVSEADSMANVLFISSGVYRTAPLAASVKIGYTYAYSHASNIVLLLASLGTHGRCLFSDRQIVTWNAPSAGQEWASINLGLGLMTVLELSLDPDIRRRLAGRLLEAIPHIEHFVVNLLLMALAQKKSKNALYMYDQLCSRLFYFDRRPITRAKIALYRLALRYPRFGYSAIETYKQMRRGKVSIREQVLVDRFERM